MRTTVDIPDAKYRRLKSQAASQGTTVKALVLEGIEVVMTQPGKPKRGKLKLPVLGSREPGSLDIDNDRIYDVIGFP